MRSRRRKEESVKKDGEIKEKWRVGGAVCLFSFKRAKNSEEAAQKEVGKEDSVVKTAFVRRSTTLIKSQMSLLIFMNAHFIPLTPAVNAEIGASNSIGTLFNGVRVPATNINFRSHKNECGTKLFHKICLFSSSSRPQSVSRGLHLRQAAVCETVARWKKAVNQANPDTSKSNTEPLAAPGCNLESER